MADLGGIVIFTYIEVLDVAENLVVQSEVVAGDDVDTGILLDLPVGESEPLGLSEELILGDLAAPVCYYSSVMADNRIDS